MNPKTAKAWIEAYQFCGRTHGIPLILAQVAAKQYRVAMRKAVPAKPRLRLPRGSSAMVKKESIPKLKKELDRVFSIVIRTAKLDDAYRATCVTCRRRDHWKKMDAGHYVPRQDLATRWMVENVWPQCKPCNGFRGGEPEKMAAWIDRVYGAGKAASIREKSRAPLKLNRQWIENQIATFKAMIPKGLE